MLKYLTITTIVKILCVWGFLTDEFRLNGRICRVLEGNNVRLKHFTKSTLQK